jgi:hypothetical protein
MPLEEAEMEDGMSIDEEARAELLTPQELDRIDNSLLSYVTAALFVLVLRPSVGVATCVFDSSRDVAESESGDTGIQRTYRALGI